MMKDKNTPISKEGDEIRKLDPEKVIDIHEGIQSLLDIKAAQNIDQLRAQVASCCLQACDCCLQIS